MFLITRYYTYYLKVCNGNSGIIQVVMMLIISFCHLSWYALKTFSVFPKIVVGIDGIFRFNSTFFVVIMRISQVSDIAIEEHQPIDSILSYSSKQLPFIVVKIILQTTFLLFGNALDQTDTAICVWFNSLLCTHFYYVMLSYANLILTLQ